MTLPYWIVPKSNFVHTAMPPKMKENILDEQDLENMEDESGMSHDFSKVYVVDQNCPREGLGKKVRVLALRTKTEQRTKVSQKIRRAGAGPGPGRGRAGAGPAPGPGPRPGPGRGRAGARPPPSSPTQRLKWQGRVEGL